MLVRGDHHLGQEGRLLGPGVVVGDKPAEGKIGALSSMRGLAASSGDQSRGLPTPDQPAGQLATQASNSSSIIALAPQAASLRSPSGCSPHLSWRVTRNLSSSGVSAASSLRSTSRFSTAGPGPGESLRGSGDAEQRAHETGGPRGECGMSRQCRVPPLCGLLLDNAGHRPSHHHPSPSYHALVPQLASASSRSLGTCLKKRRCSCCTRS